MRKLLTAQARVRKDGPDPKAALILDAELHEIRRLWRTEEQDWTDSLPRIYREVTGEDLNWVQDDTTGFSSRDGELLAGVATGHQVPPGLVAKLLDLERDMHGMSRRAGIYEKIDQIFREDWPE
jgi:DNA sulfur modification protein DndC